MAGWHHGLDERESEWTLGDGDGQGVLMCCDSWGHKESDKTERLNWTELNQRKEAPQNWESYAMPLTHNMQLETALAQGVILGHKTTDVNLDERQISK